MANVHIGVVDTQVTIDEPRGSLSREELQKIVQAVIELLREEELGAARRRQDTAVRDRAWRPPGE